MFSMSISIVDKRGVLPMPIVWINCQDNKDIELSIQIDIKSHVFIERRIMVPIVILTKITVRVVGTIHVEPHSSWIYEEMLMNLMMIIEYMGRIDVEVL